MSGLKTFFVTKLHHKNNLFFCCTFCATSISCINYHHHCTRYIILFSF